MMFATFIVFYVSSQIPTEARVLPIHKRSSFYVANETACVVDGRIYYNGEKIPTDNPCESCRCRPPGFSCVLHECEIMHGCKAIRREGECCPEYLCGCEHNGQLYRNGEEIRDPQNPCYKCHCQGNSIVCAFLDCTFRRDCPPRFISGECCPYYSHCRPSSTTFKVSTAFPQWNTTSFISTQSSANTTMQLVMRDMSTILPDTTIVKEDASEKFISDTVTTTPEIIPTENDVHTTRENIEITLSHVTTELSEVTPRVDEIKKQDIPSSSVTPEREIENISSEVTETEEETKSPSEISDSSEPEDENKDYPYPSNEYDTTELTTRESFTLDTEQSRKTTLQKTKVGLPEARSTASSAEILEPYDEETEEEISSEEIALKEEETEEDVSTEEEYDDVPDKRREDVEPGEEASTEEESTEEVSSEEVEEYQPSQDQAERPSELGLSSDDLPTGEDRIQVTPSADALTTYEYATHRNDYGEFVNFSTISPVEFIQHLSTKHETIGLTENYSETSTQIFPIETTAGRSDLENYNETSLSVSSETPDSTVETTFTTKSEDRLPPELTITSQTAGQIVLQTISDAKDGATIREQEHDDSHLTDTSPQTITRGYEDLNENIAETVKYEHSMVSVDEYSTTIFTAPSTAGYTVAADTDISEKQTEQATIPNDDAIAISEEPIVATLKENTPATATSLKQFSEMSLSQENIKINTPEQHITTNIDTTLINEEIGSSIMPNKEATETTMLSKEGTSFSTDQTTEMFTTNPHIEEVTIYRPATTERQTFDQHLDEKSATETSLNREATEYTISSEKATEESTVKEQNMESESYTEQPNETSVMNEQKIHEVTIKSATTKYIFPETTIRQTLPEDNSEQLKSTMLFEHDFQQAAITKKEGTEDGVTITENGSINEEQTQSTTEEVRHTDFATAGIHYSTHSTEIDSRGQFTETKAATDATETSYPKQTIKYIIHNDVSTETASLEEQTVQSIKSSDTEATILATSTVQDTEIYSTSKQTTENVFSVTKDKDHTTVIPNTESWDSKDTWNASLEGETSTVLSKEEMLEVVTVSTENTLEDNDLSDDKITENPTQTSGPYMDQDINDDVTIGTVVKLVDKQILQNISTENNVMQTILDERIKQTASTENETPAVPNEEEKETNFVTQFSIVNTAKTINSSIRLDNATTEYNKNVDIIVSHIPEESAYISNKNHDVTSIAAMDESTDVSLKDVDTTATHSYDDLVKQPSIIESTTDVTSVANYKEYSTTDRTFQQENQNSKHPSELLNADVTIAADAKLSTPQKLEETTHARKILLLEKFR